MPNEEETRAREVLAKVGLGGHAILSIPEAIRAMRAFAKPTLSPAPAGREAIAREARASMQRLANTRMELSLAEWGDVSSPLFAAIDCLLALAPSQGKGEDWLADIEVRASNAEALWKEAGAPGPDKCDRVPGSTQYGAMMAFRRLAKDMRTPPPGAAK